MNKTRIIPIALAALLATGAAGGLAFAKESGRQDNDAAKLASAKVTLQQAIAMAEQQAGGQAVSADFQQEKGVARIEVEVAGPQGVKTVLVDAQTGQVTTTHAADQADEDND